MTDDEFEALRPKNESAAEIEAALARITAAIAVENATLPELQKLRESLMQGTAPFREIQAVETKIANLVLWLERLNKLHDLVGKRRGPAQYAELLGKLKAQAVTIASERIELADRVRTQWPELAEEIAHLLRCVELHHTDTDSFWKRVKSVLRPEDCTEIEGLLGPGLRKLAVNSDDPQHFAGPWICELTFLPDLKSGHAHWFKRGFNNFRPA
jgi:hypothetical protein